MMNRAFRRWYTTTGPAMTASKIAYVFAGQGTARTGMCVDLRKYDAARVVLDRIDEALGEKLSKRMETGDELLMTHNQQPALLAHSMAVAAILEEELGIHIREADALLGHSVGEYAALTVAGSLELEDAAKLLRIRGLAMTKVNTSSNEDPIGMAAILGIKSIPDVQNAVDLLAKKSKGVIQVSGFNTESQVTVSGHIRLIEELGNSLKSNKLASRTITIRGNGPYHCSLMLPAQQIFADAISSVKIKVPTSTVISNVTAKSMSDPNQIRSLLTQQIVAPVQWLASIRTCVSLYQVRSFIECGAGKTLGGLINSIDPKTNVVSIDTMEDMNAFIKTNRGSWNM